MQCNLIWSELIWCDILQYNVCMCSSYRSTVDEIWWILVLFSVAPLPISDISTAWVSCYFLIGKWPVALCAEAGSWSSTGALMCPGPSPPSTLTITAASTKTGWKNALIPGLWSARHQGRIPPEPGGLMWPVVLLVLGTVWKVLCDSYVDRKPRMTWNCW